VGAWASPLSLLVLVLEEADVSLSERLKRIIMGESDSLFAAEAQQIEHEHDDEHEHDSPKLRGLGLIIII
jgi:hypothetical protein